MADAEIAEVKTTRVTLVMDEEEAGYLLDVLTRHLAGTLVGETRPLGSIRLALKAAQVQQIKAWRVKGIGDYAAIYATHDEVPVAMRTQATQT